MTSPQDFKDAVDRGETVLDYGVYFEYKTQSWDTNLTGFTLGGTFDPHDELRPARSQDVHAGPVGQARHRPGHSSKASSSASSARSRTSTTSASPAAGHPQARRRRPAHLEGRRGQAPPRRRGRLRDRRPVGQHPAGQHEHRVREPARRPEHLQRAAHVHADAVHVQPRLPGRHDPVAPPRRRGHQRGLRQAVPVVRPDQVDHVQGREHHVVRAQAGRDAGQRDHVRHRVRRRPRLLRQPHLPRHLVRRAVPARRDGAPGEQHLRPGPGLHLGHRRQRRTRTPAIRARRTRSSRASSSRSERRRRWRIRTARQITPKRRRARRAQAALPRQRTGSFSSRPVAEANRRFAGTPRRNLEPANEPLPWRSWSSWRPNTLRSDLRVLCAAPLRLRGDSGHTPCSELGQRARQPVDRDELEARRVGGVEPPRRSGPGRARA